MASKAGKWLVSDLSMFFKEKPSQTQFMLLNFVLSADTMNTASGTLQVTDHHWLCTGHVFCPSYGPECCVVVSVH